MHTRRAKSRAGADGRPGRGRAFTARARRPGRPGRSAWRRLAAAGLLTLAAAASAGAEPMGFAGTLRLEFPSLPDLAVTGAGVATLATGPGGVALEALWLDGGPSGSAAAPVSGSAPPATAGVAATLRLGSGALTSLSPSGPPAPGANALPVAGEVRLCFYAMSCGLNLGLPLTRSETRGLGIGGTLTLGGYGPSRISVQMAPWTLHTATLPLPTAAGGSLGVAAFGWAHGPFSLTGSTALSGGALSLVTPMRVRATAGGGALAGFSRLTLRFVPEPAPALLLGCGALALLAGARRRRGRPGRAAGRARGWLALALMLLGCPVLLGCPIWLLPVPRPGLRDYQRLAHVAVPGGLVNAAGGNLILSRRYLAVDTLLGTLEIDTHYDSQAGRWHFGFQSRYDGASFVDPSGAVHDVSGLAPGETVPGTGWRVLDAARVATLGGLVHHFGPDGRTSHLAWTGLDYPRLAFDWSGGALAISQCSAEPACAPLYQVSLDAQGRPVAATEARSGRLATFGRDGSGRLVQARGPLDHANGWPGERFEYAPGTTLLAAATGSHDERVEYRYQGRRVLEVAQLGAGDPTHRFAFLGKDAEGLFATVHTDPLGHPRRYLLDWLGRLHRLELEPTGEVDAWTWSGLEIASHTDPGGATTTFTRVGDDRLETLLPSGNLVVEEYEPDASNFEDPRVRPLRRRSDALGLLEERGYDASGRVVSIANGAGESRTIAYNPVSRPAQVTLATGISRSHPIYGVHGHWLESSGGVADKRLFDPVGNARVPSLVGQEGGFLTRGHDANRALDRIELAATEGGQVLGQAELAVQRRGDGRPLRVSRPGGGDHVFDYDALGRLAARRVWSGGQWHATTFEYDLAGRLTARQRPNGMREEFAYDPAGRLLHHRALRDGALEAEALYVFAAGRLESAYDSVRDATESYAYDGAGRLVSVLYGHGETRSLEYDLRSRLRGEVLAVPGQGVVADLGYAYDAADRRVRIEDRAAGEVLVEHWFERGRLSASLTGNGLLRAFAYDPETGFPTAAATTDGQGGTAETTQVVRTLEVGPPRQSVAIATTTALASSQERYWLDLDGSLQDPDQLSGNRVFHWDDGAGRSREIAHDALGSQVSGSGGDVFVYDAEGVRLLTTELALAGTSLDYGYDEAGYATARAGVPIAWTATGRIAAHGGASFAWDLRGRLVSGPVGGTTRHFAWFGGRVEGAPGGPLGWLDLGEVCLHLASGERLYRHPDLRGHVSFVSDAAGQVVRQLRYRPYGPDAVFGSGWDWRGFDGALEAGPFLLLGARVYDPAVGRFLSPDPVFALVNAYAYTTGNPLAWGDPGGTSQQTRAAWAALSQQLLVFSTVSSAIALSSVGTPLGAVSAAGAAAGFITAAAIGAALETTRLLEGPGPGASRGVAPRPQGSLELELESGGMLDVGGLPNLTGF